MHSIYFNPEFSRMIYPYYWVIAQLCFSYKGFHKVFLISTSVWRHSTYRITFGIAFLHKLSILVWKFKFAIDYYSKWILLFTIFEPVYDVLSVVTSPPVCALVAIFLCTLKWIQKLKSYEISSQIFGLVSSFLSNRRFRVVLDEKPSQEYPDKNQVRSSHGPIQQHYQSSP